MSVVVTERDVERSILSTLDRLEEKRLASLRRVKVSALFVASLALFLLVVIYAKTGELSPAPFFVLLGISGLATWGAFRVFTAEFRSAYKREVVDAVIEATGEELTYYPESCVSKATFKESQLFRTGIDRYRGEDYISGKVGATQLYFSELHAEYRTTSGKSSSWHTIFKGVFIVADFNKHFSGRTVVLPDTAERLLGFIGQKLQEMDFTRGELVRLEDPEFERAFCVYSDDQVEARYILSLSLMQRILEYTRKMDATVHLAFIDSRVFIAVGGDRNRFEPQVFTPANDLRQVREFQRDLELIIGVVEDLDLNTRIWSKE